MTNVNTTSMIAERNRSGGVVFEALASHRLSVVCMDVVFHYEKQM